MQAKILYSVKGVIMERDKLCYDVARNRIQEQDKRRQHFDMMATAVLGFSGVIVSVMALSISEWADWSFWPAVFVLIFFAVVALSTIKVLWVRKWELQPPLADLYKYMDSAEYNDKALTLWTAKQMATGIKNNCQLPPSMIHPSPQILTHPVE
jgi:hypothetical protein